MRPGIVLATGSLALLAACSRSAADPAMETKAVNDYPTRNAAAVTVYFRDCGAPDTGRIVCHSCGNEMIFDADGQFHIYADNNEQTFEGNPPAIRVTQELSHRYVDVSAADNSSERSKGASSYQAYLTRMFEAGNDWCAGLGGNRRDVKNIIADAAQGKAYK